MTWLDWLPYTGDYRVRDKIREVENIGIGVGFLGAMQVEHAAEFYVAWIAPNAWAQANAHLVIGLLLLAIYIYGHVAWGVAKDAAADAAEEVSNGE
ncbi:MAG: hypothetical protein ABEI57_05645 [Halapricum sp.]